MRTSSLVITASIALFGVAFYKYLLLPFLIIANSSALTTFVNIVFAVGILGFMLLELLSNGEQNV